MTGQHAPSGPRVEVVPNSRAIFQSDDSKAFKCPICRRWVFSQYEGDVLPEIVCEGGQHRLIWSEGA